MKHDKQPAKISYFFGPGWHDLGGYIKEFWSLNQNDIKTRIAKTESAGRGIMTFSGAARFMSCISLILFGTLFFVIISSIVSVILGIAFLIVYVFFFLIWVIDRLHLLRKGIFVACPNCKDKFLIPVYLCPSCGVKHTKLVPGKYGVFKRKCDCGAKIPTHVFTHRDKLEAECPSCGVALSGTGNRPICIPVVGGRSAGKTAFITAFSYDFIEKVAPRNGFTISHYNSDTEKMYKDEITQDYINGTTRLTKEELDIKKASSKPFSFILQHKRLNPDRLIQIYDVAGESFVNNSENETQLQYNYCNGIIMLLDPLSMITVSHYLDESISEIDRKSVGTLDMNLVLDAFLNKLREVTGKSSESISNIPVAVVISKSDIRTLNQFIGDDMINDFMTEHDMDMDSYYVAEDRICREFLMNNGLEGFVNIIEKKFKYNRFFKCSAIGHTREFGRYNPKGVLPPMEWIFQTTDSGLKSVLHENTFKPIMRGD